MFEDNNFYRGDDNDNNAVTIEEKRKKCKEIYDALVKSCDPEILIYDGDVEFFTKVRKNFDCEGYKALYNRYCCLLEKGIKK